jgi:septation ring formation regulator EzrA
MTSSPTTLTYSLEDFLERFEQRIERKFAEMDQKMDKRFAEMDQKMDQRFAEVNQQFAQVNQQFAQVNQQFAEVNQKLVQLEIGQVAILGEVKVLDQKTDAIEKRLDNQEFINRGVLVAVIVTFIGGAAKFFGWLPVV